MKCPVIRLNAEEAESDFAKAGIPQSGRQFLDDIADVATAMNGDREAAYRLMFPIHRVVEYRLIINGRRKSGKLKKALVQHSVSSVVRAITLQYANNSDIVAVEIVDDESEMEQAA